MDKAFCFSHHVYEPIPADAFTSCFECGHVYATWADLVAAEDVVLHDMGLPPRPGGPREITICPHCNHDL